MNSAQSDPQEHFHARAPGFVATRWTLILTARKQDLSGSASALEELCRTYWYPLYAHARRQGKSHADAEDITQAYFARFLEKRYLDQVDNAKGRFRNFLLSSMTHFMAEVWRRDGAAKRGKHATHVPFDTLAAESRYQAEAASGSPVEDSYDSDWARTVFETAGRRLQAEYSEKYSAEDFEALRLCAIKATNAPQYNELANRLGRAEGTIKADVFEFRRRFRNLLREEVAPTVEDPADVDEELAYLIGLVAHSVKI